LIAGCSKFFLLMWKRLRRFSALERPAQALFLRAIVLLPLVALSFALARFSSHASSTATIPFECQAEM